MAALSSMLTEARSLFGQTDANNSQITDAQLIIWANEAYRTFIARNGELPETVYELTSATGDITLSTELLTPLRAYMVDSNGDYRRLEIIGVDVLDSIDPSYLSADTGQPSYLVRNSTFTAFLYPQPNAANTGLTIKFHALAFPTELNSTDDNSPILPKNLQDLMPHYMAWRALEQMGLTDRANNKLIFINTQLKANKNISTKFSGQANRWTMGSYGDE